MSASSFFPINLSQEVATKTLDELLHYLQKAIVAPALANAALLSAKGSPTTYVTTLNNLYASNNLPLPDFTSYLLMQQKSFDTSGTQTSSVMTDVESSSNHLHASQTQSNPSVVTHAKPSSKHLHASQTQINSSVTSDNEASPKTFSAIETQTSFVNPETVTSLKSFSDETIDFDTVHQEIKIFNDNYYAIASSGSSVGEVSNYQSTTGQELKTFNDTSSNITAAGTHLIDQHCIPIKCKPTVPPLELFNISPSIVPLDPFSISQSSFALITSTPAMIDNPCIFNFDITSIFCIFNFDITSISEITSEEEISSDIKIVESYCLGIPLRLPKTSAGPSVPLSPGDLMDWLDEDGSICLELSSVLDSDTESLFNLQPSVTLGLINKVKKLELSSLSLHIQIGTFEAISNDSISALFPILSLGNPSYTLSMPNFSTSDESDKIKDVQKLVRFPLTPKNCII